MKINNEIGCALCNSTWGDFYKIIEGQNLFFCCEVCAVKFEKIIEIVKIKYQIDRIDEISLAGSPRTRIFEVKAGSNFYKGEISFHGQEIFDFTDLTENQVK